MRSIKGASRFIDLLADPPFAADPKYKPRFNGRTVGTVLLALSALLVVGALASILVAPAIGWLFVAPGSAVVGSLIQLANVSAGIILLMGGWRMSRGKPAGKRQAVLAFAIIFAVVLVLTVWSGVSRADPGALLQGLFELLLVFAGYYLVALSRLSLGQRSA